MYISFVYSLGTFMVPCLLFLLIGTVKAKKMPHKAAYMIWGLVFSFYCFLAIVKVAGIGTLWDFFAYGKLDTAVNVFPFSSEGMMTYVLNVIMFLPLGFLLPFIWKAYRNPFKVFLAGFGVSLMIELLQLLDLRATDIDDLTMNVAGALLGFLVWKTIDKLFFRGKSGVRGITGNDPAILILLGTVSTFFLYNWRMLN